MEFAVTLLFVRFSSSKFSIIRIHSTGIVNFKNNIVRICHPQNLRSLKITVCTLNVVLAVVQCYCNIVECSI